MWGMPPRCARKPSIGGRGSSGRRRAASSLACRRGRPRGRGRSPRLKLMPHHSRHHRRRCCRRRSTLAPTPLPTLEGEGEGQEEGGRLCVLVLQDGVRGGGGHPRQQFPLPEYLLLSRHVGVRVPVHRRRSSATINVRALGLRVASQMGSISSHGRGGEEGGAGMGREWGIIDVTMTTGTFGKETGTVTVIFLAMVVVIAVVLKVVCALIATIVICNNTTSQSDMFRDHNRGRDRNDDLLIRR